MDKKPSEYLYLGGRKYRILEHLANKGNEGVCKAQDERLKRPVIIRWSTSNSKKEKEIYCIYKRATDNNPYLPKIVDYYREKNCTYIVISYTEGSSLDWYLMKAQYNSKYRFAPEDAYQMIRKLVAGLRELHRVRIVHGDLKPANLIVRRRPFQLIPIDFGASWTGENARNRKHLITRGYCAPEQLSESLDKWVGKRRLVDQRADQFSVSVILYQMITLRLPYKELGSDAAMYDSPIKLERTKVYNPASWSDLDDVLERSLALNPNQRFPTTDDFLNKLRAAAPPNNISEVPTRFDEWLGRFINKVRNIFDKGHQ